MPFRLQCTHAFVTFPRADAIDDKQALFDHLLTLQHVTAVLVARESHEDGGTHYHCMIAFSKRMDIRCERFFDFDGCHPNVQSVRSKKDCLKYCMKDGDYINFGFDLAKTIAITQIVQQAAALIPDRQEALKAIMERGGDRALRLFNQVDSYLAVIQKPSAMYKAQRKFPDEFDVESYWLPFIVNFRNMIYDPLFTGQRTPANKSLWIYGQTRLGKTSLARSLGTHWYMHSMWNAELLDDDAQYGVLDDIPWENMKFNYKGLLGMQKDVTVTDKYRKKSVYKGGKPVIVLSNEMPTFTVEESNWLDENICVFAVVESTWNTLIVDPLLI